jgi:spermidine/putrescine transport system permease protein
VNPSAFPGFLAMRFYVVLVFAFIFAPIVVSFIFSFSEARFPSLPLQLGSLEWYDKAWNSSDIREAFWRSVLVSVSVGVISTVIGFTAAYTDYRYRFPGKRIYLAMGLTPPMIPMLILGTAMLFYLSQIRLSNALHSVIISHVVLCTPFAMAVIRIRLAQMNQKLEEAAWNLGATRWTAIRTVILPFCWPALLASLLVCAAFSFDEFAISWFVSGMEETLPVRVLALVKREVSPAINAIGSVTFIISMGMVIIAQILMIVFLPSAREKTND